METTGRQSLGHPHQCWIILTKTKGVSSAWREFSVPVCVHCLWSCHWTPLEEYVSNTFSPTLRYLYTLTRSHWAVSSPGWTVPALTLSLFDRCFKSLHHLHSHSLHSLQCVHDFFWTEEPNAGPSSPGVASQVLSREEGSLPPTCWQCSKGCPGCHWLSVLYGHIAVSCPTCCPPSAPGSFSTKLFFQLFSTPQLVHEVVHAAGGAEFGISLCWTS